jgi:hypothetical protein
MPESLNGMHYPDRLPRLYEGPFTTHFLAGGCTINNDGTSYSIGCVNSTSYVKTLFSGSNSCTGTGSPQTAVSVNHVCTLTNSQFIMYQQITCMEGAFSASATGFVAVRRFNNSASTCNADGAIGTASVYPIINSCIASGVMSLR